MADDTQFSNLLNSLLSIDNDARTQAEVNIINELLKVRLKKKFKLKKSIKKCALMNWMKKKMCFREISL